MLRVSHDIGGIQLAIPLHGLVLAEIGAADELADDDEVDSFGCDFLTEGAVAGQFREDLDWTYVCIETHAVAQIQKSALGAVLGRLGIPFRSADGTHQGRIGFLAGLQTLSGKGNTEPVDGVAAYRGFHIMKRMTEFLFHRVQNIQSSADDLRADAVSADQSNCFLHDYSSVPFREAIRPPF